MDGLANLQPETVELPELKDYQTMYRMDQQDHSGKENEAMMSETPGVPMGIEVHTIGMDNSKLKEAPKDVSLAAQFEFDARSGRVFLISAAN